MLLFVFTSYHLIVLDKNDMETPRPVRTQLNVLLYVGSARWAGDEIDGPRQRSLALVGSEALPGVFVGRSDLAAVKHHYVSFR
jgi:hypothetical protein